VKTGKHSGTYALIWEIVRQIPRGKVASYGQVAAEAGFPGQARLVGYALHALPHGSDVPWHRVVNTQGKISFPPGSSSHRRQKRLLISEGVMLTGERIDIGRFGWLNEP
jgi:methylated-DNA-protein-cysteine methyltransferase related protein